MIEMWKALAPHVSPFLLLAQFIIAIAVAAFGTKFVLKSEYKADMEKGEKENTNRDHVLAAHEVFIAEQRLETKTIKEKMNALPSSEALHALSIQITELKGDLKTCDQKFRTVEVLSERMQVQIDRIDEFLKESS